MDAVLLDLNIPRIGGLEVLSQIQTRDDPPGVIVLTGISDRKLAGYATNLGAFDYIVKPPMLDRVESAISACISQREYHRNKGIWWRLVGG